MAKKKRAGTTKRAGAPRRTTSRTCGARKRKSARPKPKKVNLKEVRRRIEADVRILESLSTREPGSAAVRERMVTFMSDLDDLCNPANPDGCGPDMVFPKLD